ncbi:hypothetical protein ACTHGU_03240 [Chitinophagaceae bacterium MMS25-I14]
MNNREYSSISPSAKSLLFLKGHTDIPFVREAAVLAAMPEAYAPDYNKKDFAFWARVVHFESRYHSINQLLVDIPHHNILELSSGFSFRGLAMVQQEQDLHYIDTDLPELIKTKKEFVSALAPDALKDTRLEILPLNALDETAFAATVNMFPPGEIVIVNEGLLPYLGTEEKQRLCAIICKTLEQRGGYWITADIYLKLKATDPRLKGDDQLSSFFEQHRIYENMFDSFEQARLFFAENGLVVDREAVFDSAALSSVKYLKQSATEQEWELLSGLDRRQVTWRFRLKA